MLMPAHPRRTRTRSEENVVALMRCAFIYVAPLALGFCSSLR
jgi:hypothetical protein